MVVFIKRGRGLEGVLQLIFLLQGGGCVMVYECISDQIYLRFLGMECTSTIWAYRLARRGFEYYILIVRIDALPLRN